MIHLLDLMSLSLKNMAKRADCIACLAAFETDFRGLFSEFGTSKGSIG